MTYFIMILIVVLLLAWIAATVMAIIALIKRKREGAFGSSGISNLTINGLNPDSVHPETPPRIVQDPYKTKINDKMRTDPATAEPIWGNKVARKWICPYCEVENEDSEIQCVNCGNMR